MIALNAAAQCGNLAAELFSASASLRARTVRARKLAEAAARVAQQIALRVRVQIHFKQTVSGVN